MSLRIIAGLHRGRRIQAPAGLATRPTSDRAREALFGILEHGQPLLRGSRFLDLFAGSGAAALEAISRGAIEALCIDQASAAVAAIKNNIATLGETSRVTVLRADVSRLGQASKPFDIVFLDPPYGSGFAAPALANVAAGGWLAPGALVVAEIATRERFETPSGWALEDDRRYGAARFLFLRPEFGRRLKAPWIELRQGLMPLWRAASSKRTLQSSLGTAHPAPVGCRQVARDIYLS